MHTENSGERAVLETELTGGALPASFGAPAPGEVTRLVEALRAERARRADGLNEAAEEALRLVPALVRGAVRKVLFR
ncbi:hypothetical protein AB0P15_27345 [Streptomyces sp. NPDC087917]|uniref:hypothetical protein n=1 Tax=unclassified Streptomyces TaxID=2593676 RepID=UPI00341CE3C1